MTGSIYKIPWWKKSFDPSVSKQIEAAIVDKNISQGAITRQFEEKIAQLLDVKHVVACSSGSTALMMALMALDIGPGDEVIVPNRTWIATAHAAHLLGANVVLAEIEPQVPLIDLSKIESLITRRTKAILPVHMNGRAVNMADLNDIAKTHKISVIEDAAQAFLSKNKFGFLGTQSDIGCFSLSVAKTISSGQGGFAVTNNDILNEKLRNIRTHGVENVVDPGKWGMPGLNFRYTDILACIALSQLETLENKTAHLKEIYFRYEKGLKGSKLRNIPVDVSSGEIPVYIEYLVNEDRDDWVRYLGQHGIETRPFYPDLHRASYFQNVSNKKLRPSIFDAKAIYLPSGTDQNLDDIDYTINVVLSKK